MLDLSVDFISSLNIWKRESNIFLKHIQQLHFNWSQRKPMTTLWKKYFFLQIITSPVWYSLNWFVLTHWFWCDSFYFWILAKGFIMIIHEIRRSSQLRTLLKRVVVNRTWKKFQARTGFEPMTSAIPVQRSTNWANKPTGSWSMNWVQINIQVNECKYGNFHISKIFMIIHVGEEPW